MVHPISTRGSTGKESERTKEPKNQKNKKKKCRQKNNPRMGLNPSYRIPTKRRRAIPSYFLQLRQGGTFVGGITNSGTFWAVMPYGGNVWAVGGFSFFGGSDDDGGGKTEVWW